MRQGKTFAPMLDDRLEERVVPSAGVHGAMHHLHHLGGIHPAVAISLSGTISGSVPFAGSGTVSPLGSVTSAGTLTSKGAEPVTYTGKVTLTGSTGSVTATVFGRLFGFSRPFEKVNMTYTITGGTGAFAGASGSGAAVYAPVAGGYSLTFG